MKRDRELSIVMETKEISCGGGPATFPVGTKCLSGRRIRIAEVITGLVLGGGGQVMLSIARNIDRTCFDVDFYCVIEGGVLVNRIEALGFKVTILKAYDYRRFPNYSLTEIARLAGYMRACDYDIVHTHLFPADVVGRIAAVLARRPHILKTLHNMGAWKKKGHLLIDSILGLFTDIVVCVSDYQRDVVTRQEKLSPSRVVTIRHGVDLKRFQGGIDRQYAASHYGIDPAKLTVGTVGRLIEEKGQIYLLQAIPLILKEHPDTQFLIVGDGVLKETLLSYLRDKTYKNLVHFIGLREEIPELLTLMDVFVFPSLSEAFGIAPLEAMAARCPVACSSIAPLTEIVIDCETGLHFKPADHESLAEVVNRLLGDSDLRKQLTEGAYKAVESNLTETHMIRALEKLYFQIYSGTIQRN